MSLSLWKEIWNPCAQSRKIQNFTQVQLAQLSNVGTRFLSDLENGKPTCEIDKVRDKQGLKSCLLDYIKIFKT